VAYNFGGLDVTFSLALLCLPLEVDDFDWGKPPIFCREMAMPMTR
jgi:hypothetical protein